MPVAFDDEGGSLRMIFAPFRSRATRTAFIPWTDISDLITEVFPPITVGGIFDLPIRFPDFAFMFATSLAIEPVGEAVTGGFTPSLTTLPTYEKAKVTVEYETPEHGEETDPDDPVELLSHRWSAGGEFLTLPTSRLTWNDDGEPVKKDVPSGILVSTIEHEITWNHIQFPPFTAIRTRISRVNSADFSFVTGIADAETLLFLGADMQRQIMTDGARAWQVTYRFSEKRVAAADQDDPGGWNHFYRSHVDSTAANPKDGFYRLSKVAVAGRTSTNIYETTTFGALFIQEP